MIKEELDGQYKGMDELQHGRHACCGTPEVGMEDLTARPSLWSPYNLTVVKGHDDDGS